MPKISTQTQAVAALKRAVEASSLTEVGRQIGAHRVGEPKAFPHSVIYDWTVKRRVPTANARIAIEAWSKGNIPFVAWSCK